MEPKDRYEQMYEEYKNTSDYLKNDYFLNLSPNDKVQLFNHMSSEQQKKILERLTFTDIKSFILSMDRNEHKKIYRQMNENQIRGLYGILDSEDKKNLVTSLNELHIDLEERKNNLIEDMEQTKRNIINNSTEIERSTQNIANNKLEIKNQKQELKDIKKTIKKLDKERKRRLKRQLKASKPSKLDRIAIISKYRTKRLIQRMEELKETEINISQMIDSQEKIERNINDLKNHIEKEKENINQMQADISSYSRRINSITKRINDTDVTIRNLSQTEKRILGKKLYNQQVTEINRVMVTKKRNQRQPVQTTVQQIQQEPTRVEQNPLKAEPPKTTEAIVSPEPTQIEIVEEPIRNQTQNTQQSVQALLSFFNMMQQLGVNFTPNTNQITNMQSPQLMNNPITSMNNIQAMIAFYSMGCIANQLYQNFQQQLIVQQQQIQNQGRSLGFVNLYLLISVILFVLSLFLFFMK